MDKRTRVLAAMNGEKVDHVPVGFWFHFGGDEAIGEACVNAHLKYYRETDLDFVKIMCDGYFPFPLPLIRKAEDWNRVKPLEVDDPFITEHSPVERNGCKVISPYLDNRVSCAILLSVLEQVQLD